MKKITYQIPALLIITSLFLISCGGNEEENAVKEEVIIEETTEISNDHNVEYLLPSPLQIADLFKRGGLTYIGDLTNPVENVEKLNTKYDQKLNFGIYSADMAYCLMNDQSQESINYLNALRDLSEKIWMMDILNAMGLRERLESNVGNEDSLTYIMADMQMNTDNYLEENGMSYMGTVIFAGAWVETMYLGTQVIASEKNENLIAKLSEQAIVLDGLIKAIEQTDEDKEFADLVKDLKGINSHFSAFDSDSDEAFILSDEMVKALSADIVALRNKIIGA